ncbi:hypothetical protein SELMODRAFT_442703 [Selaginella moellendorffii]|uniref:phosphatidyl-N-methylethanolamine N-methyltransferase n=1 Tax=Selaginella moellendorffii TaxID=88036 RepID=D8RVE8_SELML|nr:phosphatidyl-N-methylethanolamine N-methyltransferase [Selaginella moellendorffii]EFJ23943.1 hypothetical protein SELMODRAFT_442703 [Selaginella moellendorffii]|eukprot:XP_002975158.1 phosphatidyl-N-methylethanolamine N-methyltransferase [Selaginella moellendorffii]
MEAILVSAGVLLPFPFYALLWMRPSLWTRLCGGADPCHAMALASTAMKAVQFLALASVADFSVWPPLWVWIPIAVGQALNIRVYQLLGEDGVYYGVRFGKSIPWVDKFPFGYLRDPQYFGSILSLLGCVYWIPFRFIALWCAGYLFMMFVESAEDPSTRARKKE